MGRGWLTATSAGQKRPLWRQGAATYKSASDGERWRVPAGHVIEDGTARARPWTGVAPGLGDGERVTRPLANPSPESKAIDDVSQP